MTIEYAGQKGRQGDKGTRRQGDKETKRISPLLLVSLSPCLLVSLHLYARRPDATGATAKSQGKGGQGENAADQHSRHPDNDQRSEVGFRHGRGIGTPEHSDDS